MQIELAVEALQRRFAWFPKRERAEPAGQRINQIRRQNLAAQCQRADARGDDDGSPVEIVVVLNRFARMQAGANADR